MTDKKIKSLLEKFILANGKDIWVLKEIYETEILNLLNLLLGKANWSIEDYLTLIAGCLFWQLLMNKKRENKATELTICIQLVKEELLKLYSEKMAIILGSEDEAEIITKPTPIRWLELSVKYQLELNLKIQRRILLVHFGLDWHKAENNLDRGITFNENQAATFLSKHLGWKVSTKNILEFCVQSLPYSFGAYLDRKKYCHDQSESLSIMSPNDIQLAISTGVIDSSYTYNYDGLIRLVKENKQDVFSDYLSSHTVKHLRDGGIIEISSNSPILPVQRSFSDFILGSSQFISVKKSITLFKIKSKNLIFRKEELIRFCELHKNDEENLEQLLSRPAIKKIYSSLTENQWNKFFNNENENALIKAKIAGQKTRDDRYVQYILHGWLIENGHYTPKDLAKLTNDTEIVTKSFYFNDLIQQVK